MKEYSRTQKINHWLHGILIIALLAVGFYMTSLPKNPDTFEIYFYHKSFGVVALLLLIFRLFTKFTSPSIDYPQILSKKDKLLAKSGHFILYFLIILMSFSGYLMSMSGGHGINFFGMQLPHFPSQSKELASIMHYIHTALPIFFCIMIAAHILAWPYHMIKDKVNIIKRIS